MATEAISLYSTEQIRACEQYAYTELKLTESELMERAGSAAFATMKRYFPKAKKIMVYCGSGNNAGDGYVFACHAYKAGYSVLINQFKPTETLPPTAQIKALSAINLGIPVICMEEFVEHDVDLIVDALLGTGLQGSVKEPIRTAINQINETQVPVFSLDLPSGLNADTGKPLGVCIKACLTLTFIAHKKGMYTLEGPEYCGTIKCHSLNIESCLSRLTPAALTLTPFSLPRRPQNCHKGDFGHVLIVGGNEGMPGAVFLAAEAALRVGAGLVTIATHPGHSGGLKLPELLVYPIHEAKDLESLLEKATICVLGPGLGTNPWAEALFLKVIASPLPMIIDASALRLLAASPQRDDNWVLTPHPGEAAALLGTTTKTIQENRFEAVSELQKRYGGTILLKGKGSLIETDEPKTYLCTLGNPGMATAGMGDVLSGVIAGLAAQHLPLAMATRLGVFLHAKAADEACEDEGMRGLIASDLMPYLRRLVNQ